MKNIILAILLFPLMSHAQNKNYVITGNITGKTEGLKVFLKSEGTTNKPFDDSTIIKGGKFIFKGYVEFPLLVKLIIDRTPKGEKPDQKYMLASNFYLENSAISYSGKIDSLPTYYYKKNAIVAQPIITGSASQDESVRFNAGVADLKKELAQTDNDYLRVYHIPAMENVFHTKEGIELARKYNKLEDQILDYTMNYIHSNPASVVAYDQASYMVAGYTTTLTVSQIEGLVTTISKVWEGTSNMDAFLLAAESAKKTAIGIPYQDFEFFMPDGKKVMLSEYVPKGKVVMLEFWASWCGPCRAEIPHLKHLNETKSDQFSIVSISLDENNASWQKAMKDEGMVWTQLSDPKGFEGEIARAYNIFGIPQSLILDKEGRIMKVGLRGAFLDAYLEDIK